MGKNHTASWWMGRTCTRKKRYATYAQAKETLEAMRENGRASVTLHVYRCDAQGQQEEPHFHLGNATGANARHLIRRAEKQRRKALWRDDEPVGNDEAAAS